MAANETPQVPAQLDEASLASLVEMINFAASAKDAMSDEIVTRLARTASEGMAMLDRLTRNEGVMQLLLVLERPETQFLLTSLADALGRMSRELATAPPARGGLFGIMQLARQPGTQEGLRAMSLLGKYWNEGLRELHRRGGG